MMDDIEFIFDIIIPLVVIPIFYFIKSHGSELQRQNILINKTREELAKEYVSKKDFGIELERIFDKLDKLDAKIDKLITD